MEEKIITISLKEYQKLIDRAAKGSDALYRIRRFAKYVHTEKYSISREECGAFFGFEVNANE